MTGHLNCLRRRERLLFLRGGDHAHDSMLLPARAAQLSTQRLQLLCDLVRQSVFDQIECPVSSCLPTPREPLSMFGLNQRQHLAPPLPKRSLLMC